MNPFYKVLEKLNTEEEQGRLQQPEESDSFPCFATVESQPMDQGDEVDHPLLDNARDLPADDEPDSHEVTFIKASLTDESNCEYTSVPPEANQTPTQEEILGTGSLNIRLMDQYPCYGVSDNGELTVIGHSAGISNRKTSEAEVRSGSFLEESDFSLVTEENIPERVHKPVSAVSRTRFDINVGGFVQDSDTHKDIPQNEGIAKNGQTAETTLDSFQRPCESPARELPQVAVVQDRNACVTSKEPSLLAAGIELQPHLIPQDDPLFSVLFAQLAKTPKMSTKSQSLQQNDVSLTPSVRLGLNSNLKARGCFPQTPPTAESCRLARVAKSFVPSQNPVASAPIQFPKLLQGKASHGTSTEKRGPSEKSILVQTVRNLPVAPSKRQPNFISDATGRTNVTPTSLLDAQVPFQFETPNVNPAKRRHAVIPETLPGVTLDPNQILENERLIRCAREMVGKRQLSTPDHSFVTPAKRIRSEHNGSKMTGVQCNPQYLNAISDIQMSSFTVPTQNVLVNKDPAESLGPPLTSPIAVQNVQAQASFSPLMIPNNSSIPHNAGIVYSMNHSDTNVRSEDVDLPKRHHCKACLAVFAFKENCDRHYKVVHLKRQVFRCPHCTSSYLQPKTMRGHIDKKHCVRTDEVSILPCYWCPAKFGNHQEWEFHAAQAHPEQRSKFRGMAP